MVIKRNGDKVPYDINKIRIAIYKAIKDYGRFDDADSMALAMIYASKVDVCIPSIGDIQVETIQDFVEDVLMEQNKDIAKLYIKYRYKHQLMRNTTDTTIMELLDGESEYWNTENSNKDSNIVTTQRDYIAGITSKDITKRFLLPEDIVEADEEGIIHFHDGDYFIQPITNCCLVNLEDMLQNGTVINKKMIEKPHRFLTAMTIATQIITAVASSQYGGTSINLAHLTPFVRDSFNYHKDRYLKRGFDDEDAYIFALQDTEKEVEDGVQTFNYQINSMSTTNGQTPFISVFMYISDNPEYEEETAMVITEFLKQRIQGIKNEAGVYVTQEFPKLLYVLEEKNIREDSKYWSITELAAKCNAKRLSPDYISEKKMIEYKECDVYGCMG